MTEAPTIRPAKIADATAISLVLAMNRDDRGLFQVPAETVARTIGDFLVAVDSAGQIVGCAGLHRDSQILAEIYAVAVVPQCQGKGVGRELMETCTKGASSTGVQHLWLATIKPEYFQQYGFQLIPRWELPAATLLRKLRQMFQQPPGRWLPALFGRHTFMRRALTAKPEGHKDFG